MEEVVKCPACGKRVFDLEWQGRTKVSIKCRHCNSVVTIIRDTAVKTLGWHKRSP